MFCTSSAKAGFAALAVLLLTGCGGSTPVPPPPAPVPASSPAPNQQPAMTPSTRPEGAPTASPAGPSDVARGVMATKLPEFVSGTTPERIAFEFVRRAATPDARLDPTPTSSWARAGFWCTPELASELKTQKNPAGGQWWTSSMRPNDGWVSLEVTNIEGQQAQAPGADSAQGGDLIVRFYELYHRADGTVERNMIVQEWNVTLAGGKVAAFVPSSRE